MAASPASLQPWHAPNLAASLADAAKMKRDLAVAQHLPAAEARAKAVGAAGPTIVQEGASKTCSKSSKLFPSALMANAQRDELHLEIYTYFKWLEQSLVSANTGRRAASAGTSITAIRCVLTSLETGLKCVKQNVMVLNRVVEELMKKENPPFLERYCYKELETRVEETRVPKSFQLAGKFTKSWDDRYADLKEHRHMMNTCSCEEMNVRAPGLGSWLAKQRNLYAKNDEKFIKEKAPMLNLISGFQWKQPKIVKKKAKPLSATAKKQLLKRGPQLPIPHNLYHPAHSFPALYQPGPRIAPPLLPAQTAAAKTSSTIATTITLTQQSNNSSMPLSAPAAPKKPYKYKPAAETCDFDTEFNKLLAHQKEHGNLTPPSGTRLYRWCYSLRQKYIEIGGNSTSVDAENSSKSNDEGDDENGIEIDALATTATTLKKPDACRMISVEAPPGRLGLAVQFANDKEIDKEEGAVVTVVYDNCPFKHKVTVGDRITRIGRNKIFKPEDLSIGGDKTRRIEFITERKVRGLTQEQIQRLNSIGFRWEGRSRTARSWEDTFQDLLTYYQTHGDFRVPRMYKTAESFNLGHWVHRQRFRYSKKDPYFMKELASKMEAVGFEWKPRKSYFESNFKQLVEYKRIHGHVNVPVNNSKNNQYINLGRWVSSLRYTKMRLEAKAQGGSVVEEKKSKRGGHDNNYLTDERIKLIDSIGFDWTGTQLKKSCKKKSSTVDGELEEEPVELE